MTFFNFHQSGEISTNLVTLLTTRTQAHTHSRFNVEGTHPNSNLPLQVSISTVRPPHSRHHHYANMSRCKLLRCFLINLHFYILFLNIFRNSRKKRAEVQGKASSLIRIRELFCDILKLASQTSVTQRLAYLCNICQSKLKIWPHTK